MPPAPLTDRFGRVHDNLRISVTDACNIRCFYCMPDGDIAFLPRQELLTYEEIERFVRVVAPLGVDKLRLTGGEPLVRKDLPALVQRLVQIPGIRDLALTTNGVLLARQAEPLHRAGLRRLNIHLDTLDAVRFQQITRRGGHEQVLAGIEAALRLGFRVKLNAVAVKGHTDLDIAPLARFAQERDIEVRFIEFMPLDADRQWGVERVLSAEEILATIVREVGPLHPDPAQDPHAPATDYLFAGGRGRIGVIPTITKPFCGSCNRIRLTAEGKLRYCLFAHDETDVRGALRGGASDAEIEALVRSTVDAKWAGHQITTLGFKQPRRFMFAIGG